MIVSALDLRKRTTGTFLGRNLRYARLTVILLPLMLALACNPRLSNGLRKNDLKKGEEKEKERPM